MDRNDPNTSARCSFCGKSESMVYRLIEGPGDVYICDECVSLCNDLIATQERTHTDIGDITLLKPMEIKEKLDEYVIGQDDAKKVLSVAVYNHYKRIFYENDGEDVELQKDVALGPLDVGDKISEVVHALSEVLDIGPVVERETGVAEIRCEAPPLRAFAPQ